jgi:hypothetical protein
LPAAFLQTWAYVPATSGGMAVISTTDSAEALAAIKAELARCGLVIVIHLTAILIMIESVSVSNEPILAINSVF